MRYELSDYEWTAIKPMPRLGAWSAKLYQKKVHGKVATPSQMHA